MPNRSNGKVAFLGAAVVLVGLASKAFGQDAPPIDSGDTAWVLTSSALVLMMTAPGLALFYGGLVRRKNSLSTITQSFVMMGIVTVQWVLIGYTLAFGPDIGSLIGGLSYIGLAGVSGDAKEGLTIPHLAFMVFQGMFAVITVALITGAIAERIKFSALLLFAVLWTTFVYDPLCHWVWGGGWMAGMGALDFAGGTVVHISSGVSALAAVLVMGRRRGYPQEPMPPHNLPFTIAGAALLWVGWFGFNAGSALAANGLAATAFVTTNTATAAAALAWMFAEWAQRGKPTGLGIASGAVAGLVAITPACGYVTPLAAVVIGTVAGVLCFFACNMKARFGYDDSLDVVGIHGVGGSTGALLTGIFATTAVNSAGADGLLAGNPGQFLIQLVSVVATMVYCFVVAFILLKICDAVLGLRVHEEDEVNGLDLSQHGETAYTP
jgi:Amt family ammonium transporter